MHMLSVVDLNEVLGYQHAMEFLRDCGCYGIEAVSPKDSALEKLPRVIGSEPTFLALRGLVDSVVQENSPVSDRYNILVKHIDIRAQVDETSWSIIFVSMRKTAHKPCDREQIKTIPDVMKTLNPEAFVGYGQGSYDGMAWRLNFFQGFGTKFLSLFYMSLACKFLIVFLPMIIQNYDT